MITHKKQRKKNNIRRAMRAYQQQWKTKQNFVNKNEMWVLFLYTFFILNPK